MEKEIIIAQLFDLFREFFDDPDLDLSPESSPDTIEDWDSLAHISLIVSIEKHFQVKFSMHEAAEIKSIQKIADSLYLKLNDKCQ